MAPWHRCARATCCVATYAGVTDSTVTPAPYDIVLTIRLTKHVDGATLTCVRRDGSMTWQRQRDSAGAFFPRHDLTHYAIESVLGYRRGFYGFVADGWNITDFGTPWPRGPIPADADPAEVIVGLLDAERTSLAAGGTRWTAAELSEQAAVFYDAQALVARPPVVTDAQLAAIRTQLADLFARWDALAPGDVLELQFAPGVASVSRP